MSQLQPDEVFCGRCKEDFPLAPIIPKASLVGSGLKFPLRMGYNYPISRMPSKIKSQYREWYYICGNCYFDLTDES